MRKQQRQSNGEKISFLTDDVETTRQPHAKKEISQHATSPFININSDWITNLNVKCRIIKLQEDNIGEHQGNPRSGGIFLDTTSMA